MTVVNEQFIYFDSEMSKMVEGLKIIFHENM